MINLDSMLEEKLNRHNFLVQAINEKNISLQAIINEANQEIEELKTEQLRLQGEYKAITEVKEAMEAEVTPDKKNKKSKNKEQVILEVNE